MTSIEFILRRLGGVKASGPGCTARSPARQDQNASLSVGVGKDDWRFVRWRWDEVLDAPRTHARETASTRENVRA